MVPPKRLSRFLSYLLRHRPSEHPLGFDRQGFVPLAQVLELVQERYYDATEQDVLTVIAGADKKRFELRDDKVRATYGHSFPVDLGLEPVEPPAELYYGTARDLAQSILRDGLKPRDRRYVHLSASLEEAEAVAKRHDPTPLTIVVDTRTALKPTSLFTSPLPYFSPKTCRRTFFL